MDNFNVEIKEPDAVETEIQGLAESPGGKVQSNYTENDPQAPSHILNRPFYSETVTEPLEITWDGVWGGRDVLILEKGVVFVRVSDRVFTVEELEGCFVTMRMDGNEETFRASAQEVELEGYKAIAVISEGFPLPVFINPEDVYDANSGLSAPKGTWFLKAFSGDSYAFASSLQFPSLTYEKIHKLDNKFVDSEWMATTEIGTGKKVFKAQNFYEAITAGTIVDEVVDGVLLQIDTRFYTAEELSKTTLTITLEGSEITFATASAFGAVIEGVSGTVAEFNALLADSAFTLLSIEQNYFALEKGLYVGINDTGISEATDITLTINGVSGLEVPNKLPNKFLDLDWIPKSKIVLRNVISGVTDEIEKIDYIPALSDPNTIVAIEMDGIVHEVAATRLYGVLSWGVDNPLTGDAVVLGCFEDTCFLSANTTSPITVTVYENVADPIPSYFLPEGVGLIAYIHVETSPDQSAFGDIGFEIFQAYMNGGTVVLSYADADETHLRLLMCRAVDLVIQNASAIDQYGDYWVLKDSAWKKVLLANPNFSTGTPSLLWSSGVNAPYRPTALNSTLTQGSTLPAQEGATFTAIQGLETKFNNFQTLVTQANEILETTLNGGA